jgi:thiamine-monophosphate kinase
VGAELETDAIPLAMAGNAALKFALHGGEDYELLFTAAPRKRVPSRIAGAPVRQIGVVTAGRRIFLLDKKGTRHRLVPQGWEHFKK